MRINWRVGISQDLSILLFLESSTSQCIVNIHTPGIGLLSLRVCGTVPTYYLSSSKPCSYRNPLATCLLKTHAWHRALSRPSSLLQNRSAEHKKEHSSHEDHYCYFSKAEYSTKQWTWISSCPHSLLFSSLYSWCYELIFPRPLRFSKREAGQ